MYLFSAGTGGFYTVGIHGDSIPADVVQISAELYAQLIDGQSSGRRIVAGVGGAPELADVPPPSVEELRAQKIAEINAARDAAIAGGFEFNGVRYDSDAKSVQRISGAVTLGMLNPAFETDWITFDNSIVRLNAAQLAGLGAAAGQHEATQIFRARQLKDQALAATTREQLAAITW